jgi:hypothetical protein
VEGESVKPTRDVSPGGAEIPTARGLKIQSYVRRWRDHKVWFGVSFVAVTFADRRSGWQALQVSVSLGWWGWTFCPVRWRPAPRKDIQIVTLAEQVRETYRKELRLTSIDEDED